MYYIHMYIQYIHIYIYLHINVLACPGVYCHVVVFVQTLCMSVCNQHSWVIMESRWVGGWVGRGGKGGGRGTMREDARHYSCISIILE